MMSNPEQTGDAVIDLVEARRVVARFFPTDTAYTNLTHGYITRVQAIEDLARAVAREEIAAALAAEPQPEPAASEPRMMAWNPNAIAFNEVLPERHKRVHEWSPGCEIAPCQPLLDVAPTDDSERARIRAALKRAAEFCEYDQDAVDDAERMIVDLIREERKKRDAAPTDVTATDARSPSRAEVVETPPEEPVAVTSSSPEPKPQPRLMQANPNAYPGSSHYLGQHYEDGMYADGTGGCGDKRYAHPCIPVEPPAPDRKPQPRLMVDFDSDPSHMDGAIHYESGECKAWHCMALPNAILEPQTAARINTVRGYLKRQRPPWANARDLAILLAGLDALAELPQVREDLAATNTECEALRARLGGAR